MSRWWSDWSHRDTALAWVENCTLLLKTVTFMAFSSPALLYPPAADGRLGLRVQPFHCQRRALPVII